MCPAEARVAVFEDISDQRRIMTRNLTALGHTVVAEASNMQEAKDLIPQLDDLGIQVAIVDGNLGTWTKETAGRDGSEIAKGIKESNPNITVIGWSGDLIEGADMRFGKSDYDIYDAVGKA